MRILFNNIGYHKNLPLNLQGDYQINFLLHGFRQLFGADVIDFPKVEHMYFPFPDKLGLWGKGFSYAETLEDVPINRSDDYLADKLQSNFFDVIVCGVHHMEHQNPVGLYRTLSWLSKIKCKSKIICVDGNDHRTTYLDVFKYPLDLTLFKREIPNGMDDRIKPISFAIPKDRVVSSVPHKSKIFANILPSDFEHINRRTHVYTNESDYYQDYKDSYFGINSIKGGVTSLRVYEIMACGCLPVFTDLENSPLRTAMDLPKDRLLSIKNYPELVFKKKCFNKNEIVPGCVSFNHSDNFHKQAVADIEWFLNYTREKLTTEALANYVLREVGL